MQYGPVCNFADTVSVTFMHPEPIGLLSHVFFSLTFPVILGPNITGRIVPGGGGGRYIGMDQESGAFSSESGTGGGGYTVNAGPTGLLFNASKASNIYNDVATIQPSSGYSLIIIKE